MSIPFICPHCGHHTEVAEQYAGQSRPCDQCGQPVTAPLVGGGERTWVTRPRLFSRLMDLLIMAAICVALMALLLPFRSYSGEAARRLQCASNLKQIAQAMHNYHDVYKTFPPAYVADENGRPMHSWRTLLVPFMELRGGVIPYRFDEPWDSPVNRQVTDGCPEAFRCPSDAYGAARNETNYVMIVGPGMLSDGSSANGLSQIKDGTSYTIMVVEVADSGIAWAEPRDLEVDKIGFQINGPQTRGITSRHPGGAYCALCDGSVLFLPDNADPMQLKAMCTISGGEVIDESKLNP